MNRKTKIELLRAYKDGLIPISYLEPPRTYVLFQDYQKGGYYTKEGVRYTEEEYLSFCSDIEAKRKVYLNLSSTLETDQIITILFKKGYTIL